MRCLLVAVTLLVATTALATPPGHADLAVDFYIPPRLTAANPIVMFGSVRNYGPDAAENAVLTTPVPGARIKSAGCVSDAPGRCTIASMRVGAEVSVEVRVDRPISAGIFPIEFLATSDVHDPHPLNNRVLGNIDLVLAPRVSLYLYAAQIADPGETIEYTAQIYNQSDIAATNVSFTIPLPEGWSFERSLSDELRCTAAGRNVTCTIARIEPQTVVRNRFLMRAAPSLEGSPHESVQVKLTTDQGLFVDDFDSSGSFATIVYRHLPVTNTADDGAGSLREVMTRANAECVATAAPCKIVFDIPVSGTHATIRPATPLPVIAVGLAIDGRTQTIRHGDTNPSGPEIEINGSLVSGGNGLEPGPGFHLRGVVINGFPGDGIAISAAGYSKLIEGCYIGTDVTGRVAVPNGGRGVSVDIRGESGNANVSLRDNVISGNRRSGVFILRGYQSSLIGNRIGASAAEPPAALGNGASGIYYGAGAVAAVVQKNLIAFNAHAGIAIDVRTLFVTIRGNSITSNGGLGIDYGLDLVTPNLTEGFREAPNFPILSSAVYDEATNTTRIEGRIEESFFPSVAEVELFANSAPDPEDHGEGELPIGRFALKGVNFTFTYPGDLRGRFITATFTKPNNYYPEILDLKTSEFSRALRVEGDAAGPIDPALLVPRGADLAVRTLSISGNLLAGLTTQAYVSVVNFGPSAPENAVLEISIDHGRLRNSSIGAASCVEAGTGLRCNVGEFFDVPFEIDVPMGVDKVTIRARVTATSADPSPANNELTRELTVSSAPNLSLQIDWLGAVDPGATARYTVHVANSTAVDARDVVIAVPLLPDWSLVASPTARWSCAVEGTNLVCRTPLIEGQTAESFEYTLRAPASELGQKRLPMNPQISSASGLLYHPFSWVLYEVFRVVRVTRTSDDGPGSLREAIEQANRECGRDSSNCKLVFAIDASSAKDGVFSIRPTRPLPIVNGTDVTIDARTQTEHTGDSNPLGPEVELNGSQLADGNGLEIVSDGQINVRGLIINGFRGNGLVVKVPEVLFYFEARRVIADNYIGTDATGRHAVPNAQRGVSLEGGPNGRANAEIVANVISGNNRSGIFVASGERVRITGNRIGLTAGEDAAPLPNHASGIYLGAADALVANNEIASNDHAGIAVDRNGSWNGIQGNTIRTNGGLAIDHGIDGVTFNDDPNRNQDLPRFPVILSAVWDDSAKVTRIEGRAQGFRQAKGIVEIFRNASPDPSGYGEAERSLGQIVLQPSESEQPFTLVVSEDLRGSFVTATLSRSANVSPPQLWTSEVGAAVGVR